MQHFIKGVDYAAQGKFKTAKDEFDKALKADPFLRAAKIVLKAIEDVNDRKIKSKTAIHLFKGVAYRYKERWRRQSPRNSCQWVVFEPIRIRCINCLGHSEKRLFIQTYQQVVMIMV